MPILRIAIGAGLLVLVGKGALRRAAWAFPDSAVGRLALEATLGLALTIPILFFAAVAGWPINAPGIFAFCLLLAAALAATAKGHDPRRARPSEPPRRRIWGLLPLSTLALFAFKVARAPLWSWDHYAVWGVKARRLVAGGRLDLSFLRLAAFVPSHPDAPLGLPLAWRIVGLGHTPDAIVFKACHVLLGIALAALVREGARESGTGQATANILAAFTAVSPLFWDTEAVGIAEMPLALLGAGAFFLLLRLASRSGSSPASRSWLFGYLLGTLAWIKGREGLTLAILTAAAGAILLAGRRRLSGATARSLFVSLVLAAGSAFAATARLPPGERFLAGDWRSRGLLRMHESGIILRMLGRDLLQPDWMGFWALFAVATAAAVATRKKPTALLAAAVWGQVAVYSLVYFVTYLDPEAHLRSSFFRIVAALLPLAVIALAPLLRERRPASIAAS